MTEVTLYCGDCLDFLRTLPDGCVDAVVTDPPYGIKITRSAKLVGTATHRSRKASGEAWDDNVPTKEYFDEMRRVSRHQIIFGANFFMEFLPSSKCYIVWDKRGDLPDVPFSPVEWAWCSHDRQPKRYIVRNHGFIRDSKEDRQHPTQKPLLLMKQIIEDFTRPGDTVLDCFAGSGTTGVACVQTGRSFIGVEIDPGYFQISHDRIQRAIDELYPLEEVCPKS